MPRYALKFISGRYQGAEIPVPEVGDLIIGRATDLDIVLAEDMVSRKHARLVAADGELTIIDLGSTNGTFVNGEKVRRTTIKRNDRVLIGTSILKLIGGSASVGELTDRHTIHVMLADIAKDAPEGPTMSGSLQEVPLPDLLQLFSTNRRTGVLTVDHAPGGGIKGRLFLRDGQLEFAAEGAGFEGPPMKALCRMVGWKEGDFRMEDWDGDRTFDRTLNDQGTTESLLMEAMRQHDELQKLREQLPPPTAPLTLCLPLAPALSGLGGSSLDTLQLALNFHTVGVMWEKGEATDFEIASRVDELIRGGFLELAGQTRVMLGIRRP